MFGFGLSEMKEKIESLEISINTMRKEIAEITHFLENLRLQDKPRCEENEIKEAENKKKPSKAKKQDL